MSCLEAGAPRVAPGGHCFHQKVITALSFQVVTLDSLHVWGQCAVLGQGPCARGQGPGPRHHPGGPVAEAEAPRLGSCWMTGCLPWGRVPCPRPGPQQTPLWATPLSLGRMCPPTDLTEGTAHGKPHLQGRESWVE